MNFSFVDTHKFTVGTNGQKILIYSCVAVNYIKLKNELSDILESWEFSW